MSRPTSLKTRRELTVAIAQRYQAADRPSKKAILDEFVKLTGYHRKHAIRILSAKAALFSSIPFYVREYLQLFRAT